MKKKLFSFFSFALVALLAQAQSWEKPTLQYSTESVPEQAYIYNIEAGKFLTKGGAWGNHASVKSDASVAFLYDIQLQEGAENVYKLHCSAGANTGYTARQSAADVYTDYKSQADWSVLWEFNKTEGGYIIRTAASCPVMGYDKYAAEEAETNFGTYILGWNPEREDLTNGNGAGMGTYEGIYMVDPNDCEGYMTLWGFVTPEIFAVYKAQSTLYDKLAEAMEVGYQESELADYAALLTSSDVEAINAAIAVVNDKILNYAYDHATPENPFEVTSKIQNPTFEGARGAEPEGWTDEFSNMLIQNNKAYYLWNDEEGAASSEYGLNNFSQNWTKDACIAESHIYQIISELPQGTYILKADAIATTGSADAPVSGCELYAESGAARYAVEVANEYGAAGSDLPRRYKVLITHMGGDLKIGYHFVPGHVKWFAVDNFKLYYAGPVDNPGLVALTAAVEAATPYVDEWCVEAQYYYSEATKDALSAALDEAASITESEACLAQAGVINDLVKTAKAEVKAYADLAKFNEKVAADAAQYDFLTDLADKRDLYQGAYEDKSATIEQINEWIASYQDYLVAGIREALPSASEEKPIEVTPLYANLGFEENTTESATPTNWTCNSSAFKARANVGEVWNASFDAHVTLEGLPAGAYRITAHALSRSGSNAENYAQEGANVTAELYANNAFVKVKSQHLGAGTEKLHDSDDNVTGDEENPIWGPNSMEGARVYFDVEDTPYFCEVVGNVVSEGDPLVVGVRDLGADGEVTPDSWTIWSDVRVYYLGVSSNALYEEMQGMIAEAEAKAETSQVTAATDKLEKAATAAKSLGASASEAEITEAIAQMKEALDYYKAGQELVSKVMSIQGTYDEILNEYEGDGTSELETLLEEMGSAVADEIFESNEVMQGWLDRLPAARTAFVFAAVTEGKTATEEEPIDVSAVMSNPSFSDNTANGWTLTHTGGSLGGKADQLQGSTAYEIWNGTAFDIHQTVPGLPEGYYRLSVKALFRNGNNSDDLAAAYFAAPDSPEQNLAQFYANEQAVNVKNAYAEAQAEDPAIDGQITFNKDGQVLYTPNTMISFEEYAMTLGLYTNQIVMGLDGKKALTLGLRFEGAAANSWFPFDDFKIEYLGTKAPTAVEGILTDMTEGIKAIYDLSGRRVSKAVKGIYIINGKKVVK